MPHGRGNHRVYHPNPTRGRGQGRGRGRGRGRGGQRGSRGGSRGAPPVGIRRVFEDDLVFNGNVEDFTLDYMTPPSLRGAASPVRGDNGHRSPSRFQSGRGRYGRVMRGLGFSGRSSGPRIPMSTLEKERPLLRPIVFVRGEHQKTLFEEVEEILHAPGEEGETLEEQTPSADLVERIFYREEPADGSPPNSDFDSLSESRDHADAEVSIAELAVTEDKDEALTVAVDTTPSLADIVFQASENTVNSPVIGVAPQSEGASNQPFQPCDIEPTVAEDRVSVSVVGITPSVVDVPPQPLENTIENSVLRVAPQSEAAHEGVTHKLSALFEVESTVAEDKASTFFIDTTPSIVDFTSQPSEHIVDSSIIEAAPLGDAADDDIIVYEAPHPRSKGPNPSPPVASTSSALPLDAPSSSTRTMNSQQHLVSTPIDSVSISFASAEDPDLSLSKHVQARMAIGLKPTPRSRKLAKKERAAARRREQRNAMFSMTSFGLSMEERAALQERSTVKRDTRYAERRRGDSDIDWGSTDDEDPIEEVCSGIGEMDLDGGVVNVATLTRFVNGAERLTRGEVVTIADLEDGAHMKEEDDETESDEEGSSQEEEDVFNAAETKEIGEADDGDSSDFSEEDTPRRSFQGRLQRMRAKGKGKTVTHGRLSSDEEDSDEEGTSGPRMSWADQDERYLEGISGLLDDNAHLLLGGNRKARNAMFKAISNRDFKDDYDDSNLFNMRKKDRHIPPELRDQWERDRAKKAERKRIRALARMEEVADVSSTHKSSRGKQKVLGGARFQGDTLYADRINDMGVLEQLIRTFLDNLDAKNMVLPPKGKEWRKRAHLLADAFSLKSKSKGKGEGRFITLIKTTRSGVGVNERKVSALTNGGNGESYHASERARRTIRHRDGDEVGKMAPRLSESNIGFKLLQQMGWEEGDRIGVTGGLADPLTAIIKTTKLGLGATRDTFR